MRGGNLLYARRRSKIVPGTYYRALEAVAGAGLKTFVLYCRRTFSKFQRALLHSGTLARALSRRAAATFLRATYGTFQGYGTFDNCESSACALNSGPRPQPYFPFLRRLFIRAGLLLFFYYLPLSFSYYLCVIVPPPPAARPGETNFPLNCADSRAAGSRIIPRTDAGAVSNITPAGRAVCIAFLNEMAPRPPGERAPDNNSVISA